LERVPGLAKKSLNSKKEAIGGENWMEERYLCSSKKEISRTIRWGKDPKCSPRGKKSDSERDGGSSQVFRGISQRDGFEEGGCNC